VSRGVTSITSSQGSCVKSGVLLYAASPVFLQGVDWQYENSGHVLVDKATSSNAVATPITTVE